jgi:predicted nucleic acid-binding protein
VGAVSPLVLIDTDILIDTSRKVSSAVDFLDGIEREGPADISLITELELLAGCRNKRELAATEKFLRRYERVDPAGSIGITAIRLFRAYRLSHGLAIPDCLIAATAVVLGIPLATKNRRDFSFIEGLTLRVYREQV